MKLDFDCVVIGAGIAGMTAAIYLKRANLNVLLIEQNAPGGLLNNVNKIENYPGFLSISGPDLAYKVYEQVQNLNIEIRYGKVLEINDHTIVTDVDKITATKIILAIGRQAIKLNDSESMENISYCALCDGNLYKDKTIALVGTGNQLKEEVLYLSSLCKKIYLITTDDLKEDFNKNVNVINQKIVKLISKNNILKKIMLEKDEITVDGMFVSLGYKPQSSFLNNIKKEDGYIVVDNNMKTNIDYIYACGDIVKKSVYQVSTAIGEAAIAAINVKKTL